MKLLVSRCETLRFTTGNTLFLGEKRNVSSRETKCFTPRNKQFQTGLELNDCNEIKSAPLSPYTYARYGKDISKIRLYHPHG